MATNQIAIEVEELKKESFIVELKEAEGWINVIFNNYPLPHGFNKKSTNLLLRLPMSYPNGRPDMFWTDRDLTLANGNIPKNADHFEKAIGIEWRRFSWHLQNWNPGNDNLKTYLEFVNNRLSKAM